MRIIKKQLKKIIKKKINQKNEYKSHTSSYHAQTAISNGCHPNGHSGGC